MFHFERINIFDSLLKVSVDITKLTTNLQEQIGGFLTKSQPKAEDYKEQHQSEFIKELTKRVEKNAAYLLIDQAEDTPGVDFHEWLHYISDCGIEVLFHEIGD